MEREGKHSDNTLIIKITRLYGHLNFIKKILFYHKQGPCPPFFLPYNADGGSGVL